MTISKKLPDISSLVARITAFLKRYIVLIFFLAISGMYGFLAYRINSLTNADPTDTAVAEKLNTVTRPRIDKDAINKMRDLEAQNIEIKTLFDNARQNPFNE